MNWQIILAFILYMGLMIAIGAYFYGKNQTSAEYILGGRKLGGWVAAMSAQASDMSGWLLMGLPGAVYAAGTGQMWIGVGLALDTVLNWMLVASRLRRYTRPGTLSPSPNILKTVFTTKPGCSKALPLWSSPSFSWSIPPAAL